MQMLFSEPLQKLGRLGEKYESTGKTVNSLFFIFTLVLFCLSIYDIGFSQLDDTESFFNNPYFRYLFPATGLLYLLRSVFFSGIASNWKVFLSNSGLGFLLIALFLIRLISGESGFFKPLVHNLSLFHFFALFLFILELSRLKLDRIIRIFNPAQLFIVSFGFIILFGTLFLLMPQSTVIPISVTDAFFTSTSAVCVTGLVVVDTATRFTPLGKLIILGLIQVGGIGVVTITSFFGFFFKETSSFREQLLLRDYFSEESYAGILKTLLKVILITFLIEGIGALFIFWSLQSRGLGSVGANFRFAVFHSISAFCNAGFSTLSDNLSDARIRDNYFLHYSVANLFILGGLGFPVFLNIYNYLKGQFTALLEYIRTRKPYVHHVSMITFNTRIVIFTTLGLLLLGTVMVFILEWRSTQNDTSLSGRIALSWFMAATPRTAGFNTVNMEALTRPTLLVLIFLMWIGASPVSTGGGIKTSTFSIALLNIRRIIRGKNHIEIMNREIHEFSVNKAFVIVFVSLVFLGISSFAIYLIDGNLGLFRIVFECFSAFSTVGLSLNLTPFLSPASKWILISLMYMGRMGIMTLLLSLSQAEYKKVRYRYPKENIIIT